MDLKGAGHEHRSVRGTCMVRMPVRPLILRLDPRPAPLSVFRPT